MIDYLLCGWHVRSAIRLPELPAWPGASSTPDVEIDCEPIPPHPLAAPPISVQADGTTFVAVPGVGRFVISEGRRIGIEPHLPLDESGIRLYLLGTALAAICYQRGLVPLHGSSLLPNPHAAAGAVIVSGDSGAGKSTLAATLALRGAPILADDVCVLDTSPSDGPRILPSVSRLKLWRDTLDRLNIPVAPLHPVCKGVDKYAWYDVPAIRTEPTPLTAIYHLTRTTETATPEVPPQALAGIPAIKLLFTCVYRPSIGVALGQEPVIAKTLMKILASVPVFQISHNPSVDGSDLLSERLLEHWDAMALC